MKQEIICFTVTVSAHDKNGEKICIEVRSLAKRTEVVSLAHSVGIEIQFHAPYSMTKEKSYPIKAQDAEKFLGVCMGEFIYEPHINIVRNN